MNHLKTNIYENIYAWTYISMGTDRKESKYLSVLLIFFKSFTQARDQTWGLFSYRKLSLSYVVMFQIHLFYE